MSEGLLLIKPLRCVHCGAELPVMGQLVTFQCPACLRYWMISHDALEPIAVYRAEPEGAGKPAGATKDRIYLPFWVADVDSTGLQREVDDAVRDAARVAAGSGGVAALPPAHEITHLSGRLASLGILRVYIPAFRSANTYAYLKVGRLLTRIQPSFTLERSEGTGHAILCALRAEEAVPLMDFIFFATLPGSIQKSGNFLEKIHLKPARPLRLVEFPFTERGASLVSVIGGFWISGRLVDGATSLVE
jgi:hypothetical protein